MTTQHPWNNWKSGAKLDLTSSTTPGLQICVIGCRVAVPRSHWSAVCLLHLPVVEGLIFCISGTPHLGTSFPLFHASIDYRICLLPTPLYPSTVWVWPECRLCCRERGHERPHTSGAAAVADTGDKVGRGRHLDIVSTPATVCPAVLVCNHGRSTGWTNSSGSYNKFDSEKPADEFSSHSRLHQTFF